MNNTTAIFQAIERNLYDMLYEYDEKVDTFSWEQHRAVFWHLTVQVGKVLRFGREHNCEPERLPDLEVLHFDMLNTYNQRFAN